MGPEYKGLLPLSDLSVNLEKALIRKDSSWTEILPDPIRDEKWPLLSLPEKQHSRLVRFLRYTALPPYCRIFSVVFLVNIICILPTLLDKNVRTIDLKTIGAFASTNLLLSILVREDFFVNLIFRSAWHVSWKAPLYVRRIVARVYVYGGLHSAAAIAGTIWFTIFTVVYTIRATRQESCTLIIIETWMILVLLSVTLLFALPQLRARYHNVFEMTHRFLGWGAVFIFWCQFFGLTFDRIPASVSVLSKRYLLVLLFDPTFYNLTLITLLIVYPWFRMKVITFYPEKLSDHALRLHFKDPVHRFACISLSSAPLREWHPFASFPSSSPTAPGPTSVIISSAGDWTRRLIASTPATNPPPIRLFTKPPKPGVLSLTTIFPRCVLLTTGSGIGPSMSSLIDRQPFLSNTCFCRLVWITRSPQKTYGKEMIDAVYALDRGAIIIDTDILKEGRKSVNLVMEAWQAYRVTNAEAVFVLSNKTVTKEVVYGLESRGVTTFGPIWDS